MVVRGSRKQLQLLVAIMVLMTARSSTSTVTFSDVAPSVLSSTNVPFDSVQVPLQQAILQNVAAAAAASPTGGAPASPFFPDPEAFYQLWGELEMIETYNGGVAVLDYDGDGDDDIFVVGATDAPNLLFENNYNPYTNQLSFTEVAAREGIQDTSFDGTGVCYADVDNDGDMDILVTAYRTHPVLYLRNSNGYTKVTNAFTDAKLPGVMQSCSFGDLNGDGKHDLIISVGGGNLNNCGGRNMTNLGNLLFIGDGTGLNWSEEGGPRGLRAKPPAITWHIAVFDMDQDGDLDLVVSNDNCIQRINPPRLEVFENDGNGYFTEVGQPFMDAYNAGDLMGAVVADFNADGNLDFMLSNNGDMMHIMNSQTPPDQNPRSRPLFGTRPYNATEPARFNDLWPVYANDNTGTAFGWGAMVADMENRGITDIVYHGSMFQGKTRAIMSNPGVYLRNDGYGNFDYVAAFEARNHQRRFVHGVAYGDFNKDGFPDVVSVSTLDFKPDWPQVVTTFLDLLAGKQLDPVNTTPNMGQGWSGNWTSCGFTCPFLPPGLATFVYFTPDQRLLDWDFNQGSIAIEMSSGNNGNKWVRIGVRGTTSKTPRDGFGAVVSLWQCNWFDCILRQTPNKKAQMFAWGTGGFLSQGSRIKNFGLGSRSKGVVEILWPTGKRNSISVKKFNTVVIPELDCDIRACVSFWKFVRCVDKEIHRVRQIVWRSNSFWVKYRSDMIQGWQAYKWASNDAGAATVSSGANQGLTGDTNAVLLGLAIAGWSLFLCVAAVACWKCRQEKAAKNTVSNLDEHMGDVL